MPVKNHQCRYGYELCHETYLGLNHDHNVVSCTCLEYFSNYYKINWIKYIDEYYDAFKETLEIYFCNYFPVAKYLWICFMISRGHFCMVVLEILKILFMTVI